MLYSTNIFHNCNAIGNTGRDSIRPIKVLSRSGRKIDVICTLVKIEG